MTHVKPPEIGDIIIAPHNGCGFEQFVVMESAPIYFERAGIVCRRIDRAHNLAEWHLIRWDDEALKRTFVVGKYTPPKTIWKRIFG